MQNKEENEQRWKIAGAVLNLRVSGQEGWRIVAYFAFSVFAHGKNFIPLEPDPEIILNDLTVMQLGVELRLCAC